MTNNTSDTLPVVAVAGGLVPWAADLLEQYSFPVEIGEEFVGFAIERFGQARAQDVVDRALMLVTEHDADLNIVGELLEGGYSMVEIQACYEAVVTLEIRASTASNAPRVEPREALEALIVFRRRFDDLRQTDDLAAVISEIMGDDHEYSRHHNREARPVLDVLGELVRLSKSLGTRDLRQVRERLIGK
jgi:hypothetical protein